MKTSQQFFGAISEISCEIMDTIQSHVRKFGSFAKLRVKVESMSEFFVVREVSIAKNGGLEIRGNRFASSREITRAFVSIDPAEHKAKVLRAIEKQISKESKISDL